MFYLVSDGSLNTVASMILVDREQDISDAIEELARRLGVPTADIVVNPVGSRIR